MSVLINADTSDGLKFTSDTSGEIKLQSAGADIATVSSTGITMASGKAVDVATALSTASGSAPSYSARAWVNFNGSGTVAIRASGNVSSITDNNTADYTVNFTTAMPDADYAVTTGGNYQAGAGIKSAWINAPYATAPTTTAIRLITTGSNTANLDFEYINIAIFR